MDDVQRFAEQCRSELVRQGADDGLRELSRSWFDRANLFRYSYHFTCLGRPIIQYPQDIVAIQELLWSTKPDIVVETGIAHGGSLLLSASMLALLDCAESLAVGGQLDLHASRRRVIGVDVDIRKHNRSAIEANPFSRYIEMIEGSSIASDIIESVKSRIEPGSKVLVILDSNHTHDHVLEELRAYAPLVSRDSYCVVFDTVIEDMPADSFPNRSWGVGNNPKTAVRAYLKELQAQAIGSSTPPLRFEVDRSIEDKLLVTVAPEGFLRRVG
ncbi:cephalosporin hydroxylase family protein [Lichenibacterium ramalinae]|uniref:Cephalosporin hydroxylase n=1 Tax=Lichenibacterium ramalinae TaxID=2316527 RepID=A0A4Q2R9N2_9HYPH|nr:cephalosporin hydroxylase [Lichenibacterium ramalinae]